jgi:hypothetical protein
MPLLHSVASVLALVALVVTLVHAFTARAPLWVAVLLVAIALLLV